jgi:hypothetical protein
MLESAIVREQLRVEVQMVTGCEVSNTNLQVEDSIVFKHPVALLFYKYSHQCYHQNATEC